MLKKILSVVILVAVTLIILFLMDLSGLNTQGTDNFLGNLDNLGITFINYHADQIYNILASLIIILFFLYLIFTLLFGARKSSN
ncbi:hypothetical protein GCM10022378_07860 [Salinicoccus jeotgali]|uniref:Uncharacterized protein n=1 Tax=Salinicoccus jeotgali TaxID=381634 RepID=A0ABP7EK13_9STAP